MTSSDLGTSTLRTLMLISTSRIDPRVPVLGINFQSRFRSSQQLLILTRACLHNPSVGHRLGVYSNDCRAVGAILVRHFLARVT